MKSGKCPPRSWIAKQPFEGLVFAVSGTQAIAMSNKTAEAGMI